MLPPFGFDQYLLPYFTQQLPDYKLFFYLLTQLGSSTLLVALASIGFLAGKGRLKVFCAVLIISLAFGNLIVDDLKNIAQRDRPDGALASGFLAKGSYSFPSGHAFTIFLTATILGAYFGRKFYAAGYTIAVVVGLSRLYLGVHWPSDVLVGAVLGLIAGTLAVYGAYRYGLCDNEGLLSFIHQEKRTPLPDIKYGNALIVAIILGLTVLYMTDRAPMSAITLTIAVLIAISHMLIRGLRLDQGRFTAFIILAIGLLSGVWVTYMGLYIVSLPLIAAAYAIIVAMKIRREKENYS